MPKYSYERSSQKFINPYTFVPAPKSRHVNRGKPEEPGSADVHTGVLRCRLYVRTPLGIPDAENIKDEEGHKKYPFYSCEEDGKRILMIPGSSLRGPLRSVYETATDSCFSTLRENTGLSKRTENENAYQPGILKWENGQWNLYQAKRYLLAVDPGKADRRNPNQDTRYTKYADLPGDSYVRIFREEKDGPRAAKTQAGETLRFGDEVEFQAYTEGKGTYKKGSALIWKGVARDVRKTSGNAPAPAGKKRGLVYIGETFAGRKHGESIFVPETKLKIPDKSLMGYAYQGLEKTLEQYRDKTVNRNPGHSGYLDFEHAKREKGIPVWYSNAGEKWSLSLASIGRTFCRSSLNDLAGERQPCTKREKLCEACMLFGMTGEESMGSRIRVTDARPTSDCKPEWVTLKILGQPRYSYLPFYARKASGVPGDYDDKGIEIAGRKFYWHNERAAVDPGVYSQEEKGKMNNTRELVMPGAEFRFDIYYDGVSEEQLDKLMWCLHFGGNEKDGNLCHKIGHGKPLGLGSVKIVIEEKAERTFRDGSYEWSREKPVKEKSEPEHIVNKEALLKVMDFRWLSRGSDKDVPIRYPMVCDMDGKECTEQVGKETAGYVWYRENKRPKRAADDPTEVLPKLLDEEQALHAYQLRPG